MGNTGSSRSRHHHHHQQPSAPGPSPQHGQPQITTNHYVFAAPSQYPTPNFPHRHYYNCPPGYYPPVPGPIPHNYHRYPAGMAPPTIVEHQKAVTIKNDVNIKKESIRVEEDDKNPGKFLVAFTFDATAAGSITAAFFAKEGGDCNVIATKENVLKPVSVSFEQGLGQKFRQASGTGIDFSMFEETEIKKETEEEIYPLVVKAEACPSNNDGTQENSSSGNCQITLAVFDKKDNGDYLVRVMKQILWVNGTRYELQEIYGIGNSVDVESDGTDTGKECVICMSEPRDITVLPCRHMCMCSGCAKALHFQSNRCPICRQPFARLLEIKVNDGANN